VNGVVVYQNVKNAHELEWIPVAAPVTVGTSAEKMYTAVMLQRDPQTQRLYLHDAITEKELDIRGTEHLKTHRGSDTTNSELYTADILRNALNVKSRQLSTGRSIDEMAGGHLSNVGHMKEEAFPKIKGSYAENGNGPRGNASTNSIPASSGNVNTNHAAARKAAQLATIERSNPFDPELGAHTWIRSAEDILTVQGGHRQLRRRG
jgi:hypothetical protein